MKTKKSSLTTSAILLGLSLALSTMPTSGQTRGGMTVYGDVKVDESQAVGNKLGTLTILLCSPRCATVLGRTIVSPGGRYRFNNVQGGEYDLVIEAEGAEIARVHILVAGRAGSDFQQDLEFAWKPIGNVPTIKAGTVSAADLYQRTSGNQATFEKAQRAMDGKKYAEAVTFLTQLVEADKQDFQAWTELGTAYLLLDKKGEAEKAYEQAVEARPKFTLALLALGRLRVSEKQYEKAIPTLTTLLEIDPKSADGNYFLGEAYLQIKKGSKAEPHLKEAAKLGRAEAHLRLATLYNALGMKDKAVIEYQEFLIKKPEYADRKKLQKYIDDNKKP